MIEPDHDLRVILIGGTSHVGKSTLAHSLASKLKWRHISTDSLARHPGRPWRAIPGTVPEHVADYYLSLEVEDLFATVLHHYRSMWTYIETLVTSHATNPLTDRLILEGSALWPECVATLDLENVSAIWLTASNKFLQTRIHNESRFEQASGRDSAMIRKFLGRTQLFNKHMMDAIDRLGLLSIDVETVSSLDELSDTCLELLRKHPLHDLTRRSR
jgi:2-phosphoglycerate kinase